MMDENNKCDLEVTCRDGTVICRSICIVFDPSKRCCQYCEGIKECNSVCWIMKEINNEN